MQECLHDRSRQLHRFVRQGHGFTRRRLSAALQVLPATAPLPVRLGNCVVSRAEVVAFLETDDQDGYQACGDKAMAHFLNSLVIYKRGKDESRPPQPVEVPVTNNAVLKKLRVAFELEDDDIIALLQKNGLTVSKNELGNFLKGLASVN